MNLKRLCVVVALLLAGLLPSRGQTFDRSLRITHQQELIYLSPYVSFLRDSSAQWDLSTVLTKKSEFQPIEQEIYGTIQDAKVDGYWLRLNVDNESGAPLNDVLYFQPGLDAVRVYLFYPDSTQQQTGISYSLTAQNRPLHISQELAMPVTFPRGRTQVYVQILNVSVFSKQLGNIIVNLAERDAFINFFLRVRQYHGIALGMLLVMMIFHIFIYFFFGGRTYLFFVLNLFITIIYLVLQKYYHQEIPWFEPLYPALRYFHDPIGALVAITVLLFTQSFLDTRNEDKKLHSIMNILAVVQTVIALVMCSLQRLHLMNTLAIYVGFLTAVVVMVASLRSFLRGNRSALYVLFGFLFFLIVPLVYMFPLPGYMHYRNNETDYHYYAEAIRSLIFAIGIADRFNGVRKAGDKAEKERRQLEIEKGQQLQAERERISRELHDNIGSQITNLGLNLNGLASGTQKPGLLVDLQNQVEQIMIQLRNTIWVIEREEIRLEEMEIKIRNMIWQFQRPNEAIQFDFDLRAAPDKRLTATQAIHILRIIQECIQNSIKHSRPGKVGIRFELAGEEFILSCEDDGSGFDHLQTVDSTHFGLANMRKRVAEIRGTINFLSGDKGTCVTIKFPSADPARTTNS